MENLSEHLPEIIRESAKSPMGILALIIVCLSVLAFALFRDDSQKVQMKAFRSLVFGLLIFAAIVLFNGSSCSSLQLGATSSDHSTQPR